MVLGRYVSEPEAQGSNHGAIRDKGKGSGERGPELCGAASSERATNEPPVLSFFIRGDHPAPTSPAVKDTRETLGFLDEGQS
jgi:hypothetical protein